MVYTYDIFETPNHFLSNQHFSDGTTIHSAFGFDFGDEHIPFGDKKLAEVRNNLQHLKLIILDEMSFLKPDMLYKIHMRLTEIFQNKAIFGGMCFILVGDLLQVCQMIYIHTYEPNRKHK